MINNFEYKEEYQYLTNICLNLTDACNLACRYCFVEQNPHYMTLQTAQDIVDWIWENHLKKVSINKSTDVFINFFGGEPMLMYDSLIKPLIEYVEHKKYKIIFGMTTNGTLLDKEKILFLSDHKVGILLSIDGFKDTQDYNRPCRNGESSFNKIINNIPLLLEKYPNITFRSTIYKDTVQRTFENYLFAEKIGFKSIFMVPDVRTSWNSNERDILKDQINKIYFYRLNQYLQGILPMEYSRIDLSFKKIKEFMINNYKQNINKNDLENKNDILMRCGLGTAFGSIGWDGSIYACQEQTSHGENSYFYLGNIYRGGIIKDKHIKLLETYFLNSKNIKNNINLCNNNLCKLYNLCSTPCVSTNYDLYKDMTKKSELLCYYDQLLFDNALTTINILDKEQNNLLFKQYLYKLGFKWLDKELN